MSRHITTNEIEIGSRIDLPGYRGVIVAEVYPDGVRVVWFDDMMRGPFSAILPHAALYKTRYHDERNGEHESYHDMHPDFTGKTGEI